MFTLNCKGNLFVFNEPVVMGIVNITSDSFYSGSRKTNIETIVSTTKAMLNEGARIIDLGAQSTRPGSDIISESEELNKLLPAITAIKEAIPETLISVDTYYPTVADACLEAGASMINDISGGRFYKELLSVVATHKIPYIIMHSRGDRYSMHEKMASNNITAELIHYFEERIAACEQAGIVDIILDPGFGFGKTIDNNFSIINNLQALTVFRKPILLGVSRKSSIYQSLGITADEALNGTTVLHTAGLLAGANLLRVHDVKEAIEAVKLVSLLKKSMVNSH